MITPSSMRFLSSFRNSINICNPSPIYLRTSLRLAQTNTFYRQHFTYSTMSDSSETGFYSLKAELPGGKTYDFAQLKGKTVLIVNVASKWCVRYLVTLDRKLTVSYLADSRLSIKVRSGSTSNHQGGSMASIRSPGSLRQVQGSRPRNSRIPLQSSR